MPDEIQPIGASSPAEKPAEETKAVPATASTSPAAELPGTPTENKPSTPEAAKPAIAEKPATEKPATAAPVAKPAAPAAGAPKPAAAAPAGVAKPAAAPGAAAKPPAAPPRPPAPKPEPWQSPMVEKLRKAYGSGLREASTYMKQNYMVVDKSIASDCGREESPEAASAKAAAYSTSRLLESPKAAIALCCATDAFPNRASRNAVSAS